MPKELTEEQKRQIAELESKYTAKIAEREIFLNDERAKAIDFSTLVKQLVDAKRLTFKEGEDLGTFTYHDSCHLKRTLRGSEAPRELLQKAGYQLAEMAECDMCCGMGGSYSLKLPEISAPILERKLQNIKATKAPLTVMDCPGCVMQIRGGFDKEGAAVQVEHTAQRLADRLE